MDTQPLDEKCIFFQILFFIFLSLSLLLSTNANISAAACVSNGQSLELRLSSQTVQVRQRVNIITTTASLHPSHLRDFIIKRNLSPSAVSCYEPERLADKSWAQLDSDEFACKPSSWCGPGQVGARQGSNVSLECSVQGSPVPAVRWVRSGRILANLSTPALSNVPELKYIIFHSSALAGMI